MIALAMATVGLVHGRIPIPRASAADASFVPRPEVARVAALGFRPLVADYYWMRAVQVVGASEGDPVAHAPLLARLIDVVTSVDPWVDHPYRFAANFLIDTPERVRFGNELLQRGIAYHPDEWRNRFYLGFNSFFYLGEIAQAADAFEAAAGLPGAPLYLSRLVARLRADTAGLETAAALLGEMAARAEDEHARRQYEAALQEIETERLARRLDLARERFRKRTGRDIRSVEELAEGPDAVLPALPPEPNGDVWKLDDAGRIVSGNYNRRYEPWLNPYERERWERWREEHGGERGEATDANRGEAL